MSPLLNPAVATSLPVVLVVLCTIFGGLYVVVRTIFTGWEALVREVKKQVVPEAVTASMNAVKEGLTEAVALLKEHAQTEKDWQASLYGEVREIRERVARMEGAIDGITSHPYTNLKRVHDA